MGREIREVPKNWQHPKDHNGHFIPLYDETYEKALADWQNEYQKWNNRENNYADEDDYEKYTFEEWHDEAPDKDYYRPAFENTDCFQMYENVTEGTPVSPVFDKLEQLEKWLVSEGHSEEAARAFCESRHAPSFVFTPQTGLVSGIDFTG